MNQMSGGGVGGMHLEGHLYQIAVKQHQIGSRKTKHWTITQLENRKCSIRVKGINVETGGLEISWCC